MKIADDIKYSLFKDEEPDNAIDLLKFDHRNVNALFAQCLKEEEPQTRKTLINEIVEALTLHSAAEEKLIYPILNVEDEQLSQEAYEEHHVIKMSLAEMAILNGTEPNFKAKVKVLSEIVNHHVLEEEAHMLPKVQRSGFDMKELAAKIRAEKEFFKAASANSATELNSMQAGPVATSKISLREPKAPAETKAAKASAKSAVKPKPKATSSKGQKKTAQPKVAANKKQAPKKTSTTSKTKAPASKKRSAA